MTVLVRWLIVSAAAVWPFALESPGAHRRGVELCVLVLAGLALTPVVGWLRGLALHIPACMGAGALAAVAVLRHQGLPLAVVAGCAAGAAVGLLVSIAGRRRVLLPAIGLTASALVAGVLLPGLRLGPVSRPVVLGIDLGTDRALYLVALGLAVAAWMGLRNLSDGAPGWRLRTIGMAPELAARSGVPVASTTRGGFLVSGAVAGAAGIVLALLHMGPPPAADVSAARAVALLAIPLLGGMRGPDGAVLGAALLWLATAAVTGMGIVEGELAAGGLLVAIALVMRPGRGLADLVHVPAVRARPAR